MRDAHFNLNQCRHRRTNLKPKETNSLLGFKEFNKKVQYTSYVTETIEPSGVCVLLLGVAGKMKWPLSMMLLLSLFLWGLFFSPIRWCPVICLQVYLQKLLLKISSRFDVGSSKDPSQRGWFFSSSNQSMANQSITQLVFANLPERICRFLIDTNYFIA